MTDKNDLKLEELKQLTPEEIKNLMKKSYHTMVENQKNFTDISISRASTIAEQHNINLEKSQILGVSFTGEYAIVGLLYTPTIVAPGETNEPKPINIPVPAECLFPHDDSWIDIYKEKLAEANKSVESAQEDGSIDEAIKGEKTIN